MRSSFIKSCLLALATASTVVAQIPSPGFDVFTAPTTPGSVIAAGSTYTIKWTPSAPAGKISIVLLEGSSNTSLQLGDTIASGIDSVTGSYAWAVPTTVPSFPFFGFKLQLDSDPTTFQYSTYFSISGLASSTTTAANTTVTVQVSQVGPVTSASTTTISPTFITVSNTTSSAGSTASGIFPNSTITTTSAGGPTGTLSSTSSAASASKTSGAVSNVAVGGTGLLGALLMCLGMLL